MTDQNSPQKEIDAINLVGAEPRELFDISIIDRLENKSARLINNDDELHHVKGQNRKHTIYFKEPAFLESMFIYAEGYSKNDQMSVAWYAEGENRESPTTKLKLDEEKGYYSTWVNRVVNSVSFKPQRSFKVGQKITSLKLYGLSLSKFENVCAKLLKIDDEKKSAIEAIEIKLKESEKVKAQAEGLKAKISDLTAEIETRENEKTTLDTNIATLLKTKSEYDATIEESSRAESKLTTAIGEIDDKLDKKTLENTTLNSQIETKKNELKKLENNINQFPASFEGFLEQGGQNIKRYAWFNLVPLALILGLTGFLFYGTANLSAMYEPMPKIDLYTMLASRLPFTLIAGGIILASYRLAQFLINEIMKITRQRLDLTRISIIAKEVSQTSMYGLDLTEKEKAEVQVKLKMDILKSHMTSIVADDYENKLDMTVWERFRSGIKTPKIKAKLDQESGKAEVEVAP